MACGCTKRAQAKAFVYIAPDGTETQRGTEIEAMALKVRAERNGEVGGEVKPVG